ncbi:MAG: LLM class flavin-dependent oxidoreductase [Myxococcota bacterium]|nr:LLM class flavin-dependent oxidoreductase [Myxococcota bacterium]
MKVSRYLPIDWPAGVSGVATKPNAVSADTGSRLASLLERVERVPRDGYAGIWLAEAQPHAEALAPAISLLAAGVATATANAASHFEIGLIETLHPFMHPLRVAEGITMLDIASEGRLRWAAHGSPRDDARFREQLDIVRRAVTGTATSHEGEFYRFEEVACHPAPHSTAGPRLHLATRDRDAAAWAREHDLGLVWDGPVDALAGDERLESEAEEEEPVLICTVYVGTSQTEAVKTMERATPAGSDLSTQDVIAGDAPACRDQLFARCETARVGHVAVRFESGKLDIDTVAASEACFLDDVLPALA